METVKIGRTEVNKEEFIKAVASNNSFPKIMSELGFNPNVGSVKLNIKDKIIELGLNHSHIMHFDYQTPDEVMQRKIKTFNLNADNQIYYDEFLSSLPERSVANYKSSCGNFMEELSEQDFITINKEQILEFASRKKTESMVNNVTAHLRSMMIYLVSNDVNGAVDKVSKEMLVWLICK
ncbi:MAG: hypothetical protein K0S18_134 [Anaerocolumna sp.]|nr:hypothetical protein [Anaerocolumna sp.]